VSAVTRPAGPAAAPAAGRIDVRAMSRLSLGHGCTDLCQGAVPALLPTLIAQRGLSLASATALVSFATIGSSIVQPLFGIWSDRLSAPLLAPLGVATAALGLGAVGLCHSYLALALALTVSGLGVALFHPEGARMAGVAGGGSARGMSYFSVGGNLGFALGPAAVLLVVGAIGLDASPLLALPGLAAAALLLAQTRRMHTAARAQAQTRRPRQPHARAAGEDSVGNEAATAGAHDAPPPAAWGPFTRLAGAAVSRTVAFFALQAFVPIYLIDQLHTSDSVGSVALVVMLASGAAGTLVGSRIADRWGRRLVLVWAMLPLAVLLVLLPHTGVAACFALLVAIGFFADAPFATTVVMGQNYLPGRAGLASGVTLGLAIGLGGLLATALGLLADATSVTTALATLPAFAAIAALLALSLPSSGERGAAR
jgi:FSR family fosmidomycin resistance protein-like MFS transporter